MDKVIPLKICWGYSDSNLKAKKEIASAGMWGLLDMLVENSVFILYF